MAILFGLIARLFYLQILNSTYYQQLVADEIIREKTINPSRGEILDANGKVLATNVNVYQVILSPQDILDAIVADPGRTYDYETVGADGHPVARKVRVDQLIALFLSEHYPSISYDTVIEKSQKEGRKYEAVGDKISEEEADVLRAFIEENGLSRCVYLETSSTRYYPYGTLAAHVIGFLNSEGVGIYGLESYYNNLLEGQSGRYVTAVNAKNTEMPFDYEKYIDAKNGYSIQTTIDVTLQNALEEQLKEVYEDSKAGKSVTGVAMDVNTGAVLAMGTYPTYDLNDPYTLDEASLSKLSAYLPGTEEYQKKRLELLYTLWKNKAVTDTYIPGSTFKIVTAAMALEENIVQVDTSFYCRGKKTVVEGTDPVHCFRTSGHGTISFAVGLQQSCNVVFMDVAERLGGNRFYSYMNAFGYLTKTGIDLPAESGSIILPKAGFDVDPLSQQIYSFGQNFNTTIIRQLTAICAVANGGYLVTPHLISAIEDSDGNLIERYETNVIRQVVSEETCRTVTEILTEGVSGNGGAKNAYVTGYQVAAKTGTSEKKDTDKDKELRVGSCVAYAPSDDPQIAVIIVVDEPNSESVYGSVVAAPYVGSFLSQALPYLGIQPSETEGSVLVSNYVGLKRESAVNALSYEGMKYEIVGDGETITAQMPSSGSKIDKNQGVLVLYTDTSKPPLTVKMIDVTGQKYDTVIQKLRSLGLNVTTEGSTDGNPTVISQSIEPGTWLSRGAMVTIEVRHLELIDD
ncbi:MAG: PASTA domain-containing protein [Clostridia bacterium]|nr:PASTA domain-containing protein [Clostridia bacterium]